MRAFVFRNFIYEPVVWLKAAPIRPRITQLLDSQYWSRDRMVRHQFNKLSKLFHDSDFSATTYLKFTPADIPGEIGPSTLPSLPFLTKDDLRTYTPPITRSFIVRKPIRKTTGGSTGKAITLLKTPESWVAELAATWRGYSWAGVQIGDPQARFWGVPFSDSSRRVARLTDYICNRYRLSAFSFDERSLDAYADKLCTFRPTYFYGYASMLDEFARHIEHKLPDWRLPLKCVISTSEVLTPGIRERLQRVFRAPVFNEYGCGELGTVAHECTSGNLHISDENMIVEVCDGARSCDVGEIGELVITELNNTATPLIRYRTGDFGAISKDVCACGCTLTVLRNVYGREYDSLRNREGRVFHGEFVMYIFEELQRRGVGVTQFQVIQESVDVFRIKLVCPSSNTSAVTHAVTQRFHEAVDPSASLVFEFVSEIPRAPSGKMRVVIGLPQ